MGPYQVRGFIHSLPGSDPLAGIGRRKPMIPLTDVRIAYTMLGEEREVRAETVIVNRDQIEWLDRRRARSRRVPAGADADADAGAAHDRPEAWRLIPGALLATDHP